MMTACEAHGPLLHYQRGEALPEPGQMRRLQMGVKRLPTVIHLIEEDVVRRLFHLDNVELSAARLIGHRMVSIVLRQSQEGVHAVGFDHEFRDDHEAGRLFGLGHDDPSFPTYAALAVDGAPARSISRRSSTTSRSRSSSTSSNDTTVSFATGRFSLTLWAKPIGSARAARLFVAGMALAHTA